MSYFVYIVFSESCNKYYTGLTQDLGNRLREHNGGEGNFTSKSAPWSLIWTTSLPSRSEAMSLENKSRKEARSDFFRRISFNTEVSRGAPRAKVVSSNMVGFIFFLVTFRFELNSLFKKVLRYPSLKKSAFHCKHFKIMSYTQGNMDLVASIFSLEANVLEDRPEAQKEPRK